MNIEAFNYCMSKNIRIYPVPAKKVYTITKQYGNKKVKQQVPYVYIEANLDGNKVLFNKEQYKQDYELTEVIQKLYQYYYERGNS